METANILSRTRQKMPEPKRGIDDGLQPSNLMSKRVEAQSQKVEEGKTKAAEGNA